jgi:hypothetical protein
VKRESSNVELAGLVDNVDGARTPMSDFMKRASRLMLSAGHAGVLVDKTTDSPPGRARRMTAAP